MITLSHYRFKQTTLKHQASSWRKVLVDVTAEYTFDTPRSKDAGILHSSTKLAQPGLPQVE